MTIIINYDLLQFIGLEDMVQKDNYFFWDIIGGFGGDLVLCQEMAADPAIHEELLARHIRKQLAAIVTKMQWSYAFFWSASTTQPG